MENAGDSSKSLSSKTKPEGHTLDSEPQIPNFPIIKQVDNARLLPRYTASKCYSHYWHNNVNANSPKQYLIEVVKMVWEWRILISSNKIWRNYYPRVRLEAAC